VFEEIAGIADGFCRQHLNAEYAQLSVALTAKLARKRPSPLVRGDRRIWASAVIYALGRVNFLSGPSQAPHLATEVLARLGEADDDGDQGPVGVDLLGLDHFDTRVVPAFPPGLLPTAWWIMIGGLLYDARTLPAEIQAELARRRLIPGILVPRRRGHPTPDRRHDQPGRRTPGATVRLRRVADR
jgi:hypothetical protein